MTGSADDRSPIRTYRGSLPLTAFLAVLLFTVAGLLAGFAVLLVTAAEAPFIVAVPFGAFAAAVLALMLGVVRSATIVEADHITVRDAGTRTTAWRDIIAIQIEDNPIGDTGKIVQCVAIYDRDGRRIVLPNLANGRGLSLHDEARAIRQIWERRRGPDWTPHPATIETAQATSAARARIEGTILGAMGCGYSAIRLITLTIVVIGLIALATGRADDLPDIPGWVFIMVFAGAAVIPVAVVLLTAVTRGRNR